MRKIVVFGASGDTGRYFTDYFSDHYSGEEYKLIAVGTRKTDWFAKRKIEYIQVDITRKEDFARLPEDVYAVVDLAGMMPARMKGYDPQRYIDVNITGGLNILEYCRVNHADRILFAQSFGDIKDYGETELILKPDMPRKFSFHTDHSIYVMTKNFMVDMMQNYYEMYGLKQFVFRLPTIYLYSPVDTYYVDGVERKIGYRLLIERAMNGEPLEVWGDASRQKDMVYIKDFCQMLYKALFVNRETGYYNVGTGVGTSLLDQIKGMAEVFNPAGVTSEIMLCPDKPNAPQYIMDVTAAKDELGYKPMFGYIDMLQDFKKEMEKQMEW